jgi:glucosamine-6-phosphate deaminase
MRIMIVPDGAALAAAAADAICRAAGAHGAVIGLPTGMTPVATYRELVRRLGEGTCDLTGARAFAIDEFLGVARSTRGTNAMYYHEHLPAPFPHVRVPNARPDDGDAEIARFAGELRAAGGFDLCVLGVGANGHVAFNEPGSPRDSGARVVDLAPSSRDAYAAAFGTVERVPERGMTLGLADLLESRALVVLASGPAKAAIVRRALREPPTADVPASWLQEHPACTWIIDDAAAAAIGSE